MPQHMWQRTTFWRQFSPSTLFRQGLSYCLYLTAYSELADLKTSRCFSGLCLLVLHERPGLTDGHSTSIFFMCILGSDSGHQACKETTSTSLASKFVPFFNLLCYLPPVIVPINHVPMI